MFNNEEVMHALEKGQISMEQAMSVLTGERATDGDRLAIGTVIAVKRGVPQPETSTSGYRDWDNSEHIDSTDNFRVYSVTKTFIADVMHQLRDEGKLNFENKLAGADGWIAKMVLQKPELAKTFAKLNIDDRATIEDLLKHTSGIGNYSQGEWIEHANSNPGKVWTLSSLLDHNDVVENGKGKNNEYGKFSYSDSGYNLLGLIIESVENMPYEISVQQRCIDKYDLKNTGFLGSVSESKGTHLAHGYIENPSTKQPESSMVYDTGKAAGGLLSTVEDLAKFGQEFYKKAKGDMGIVVPIPEDSAYLPGTLYSRRGVTIQKDNSEKPVLVMSGNARGGKAKICCYESGTCIATLETWENLTIKAAKELVKESPDKFTDLKSTILAIREAFLDNSVPPKYDRKEMLNCFKTNKTFFIEKVQTQYLALVKEPKVSLLNNQAHTKDNDTKRNI